MAIVAPKGRKHLSADALFGLVRSGFATIPDDRLSDPDISLTDALMSAFAMFSLKSPSLLAFDKERAEAGQAHLKLEWVFLYGDRVICTQNPFVPRGGTLWVCSQRHRFRTILPR